MKVPIYVVDAFTDRRFRGNPAAVCWLDAWLPDELLQAIAAENRHSETAFCVSAAGDRGERADEEPADADYELRWFTPVAEVGLCGHATLAAAHVLFRELRPGTRRVRFRTRRSGLLTVEEEGDLLWMDLPAWPPAPAEPPAALVSALGRAPLEVWASEDWLAVYGSEDEVRELRPDLGRLATVGRRGVIVTAPGTDTDLVSRFFAPALGVPEDPVTGSAHCTLAPYWARRLGRTRLTARQVSARGGELVCEDRGDRVRIGGRAALYLRGTIEV